MTIPLFDRELPIKVPPAAAGVSAVAADPMSDWGPVIFSITREQLLEDGTLIDVSGVASEAGFRIHTAITAGAWEDCVAWEAADNTAAYQDQAGRLWDVLWCASRAARNNPRESTMFFELVRIPRDGKSTVPVSAQLKLIVGPGDQGEPVATILLPWED